MQVQLRKLSSGNPYKGDRRLNANTRPRRPRGTVELLATTPARRDNPNMAVPGTELCRRPGVAGGARRGRALIVALGALVAAAGGCSSGIPDFIKYTDDARLVLLADAAYIRCHVHDVQRGRTWSFDGHFACEDPVKGRWVVAPAPLACPRVFRLLAADAEKGLAVTTLPPVPGLGVFSGSDCAFGPSDGEIALVLFHGSSSDPNWRPFRLRIGEDSWEEVTANDEKAALRRHVTGRAERSVSILGNVPPSAHSYDRDVRDGVARGKHVRIVRKLADGSGQREEHRLDAPDGRTFVTVRIVAPRLGSGWGDVRLTEVESGRTRTLMCNTDLAHRIVIDWIWGPIVRLGWGLFGPSI